MQFAGLLPLKVYQFTLSCPDILIGIDIADIHTISRKRKSMLKNTRRTQVKDIYVVYNLRNAT